jgi:preprotein translocase subunit YajC
MVISSAYAQTVGAAPAPDLMGGLVGMLPIFVVFLVMWALVIRPQMKKSKEHQKLVSELAKGDEIVIQGGVVGRVSGIGENYLHLEVAEGKNGPVELVVQKSAVAALLPKGSLKNL